MDLECNTILFLERDLNKLKLQATSVVLVTIILTKSKREKK